MAMTPRRRRFVEEYLIDLNASAALRRAGFSARSTGQMSRIMRAPEVAAAIRAGMAERSRRTGITADAVLVELARIGFSNMLDYMRVGETGELVVDLSTLDRDKAAAIAEITVEDLKDRRRADAGERQRIRFKLLDKRGALVDLGKHLGVFRDGPRGPAPRGMAQADGDEITRIELAGPAAGGDDQ